MMGLMTRMACSAQRARLDADHSNHFASSVRTSSITLLSTRTSATLVSGQGHNFVSRQFYCPFPSQMGYELASAVFTSFLLSNAYSISDDVESDFGIGKQPEPFAYVLWNRDLSLRCHTHNCLLLLLILLLPTCRDQDTTSLLKRPTRSGTTSTRSWRTIKSPCDTFGEVEQARLIREVY